VLTDVHEWLAYGQQRGWCSPTACSTHDGVPATDDEDAEFEEGYDPCIHVVRLYAD
jgi:hypothetical protein